jgi:SAM-dependent methyltransferase
MGGLKLRYLLEDLDGAGRRYLDVGCGGGAMARAVGLERPGLSVHGVDLSRAAVRFAARQPEHVSFAVGEAQRLPYGDSVFDAVSLFDVLEHVDEPELVLAEIARVLRPGGLLHVALPLEAQPGTVYTLIGTGTRWKAKLRHGGHVQLFDSLRYTRLATASGLPVVRTRWSYHHLFALIDVLFFLLADLRGPLSTSVEDAVAGRRGALGHSLRALKGLVAALGWYEARLFRRRTGACGHFTSRRTC